MLQLRDDFVAAAEHLIAERYTSSDRLAIHGGSAGGLLMGAVVNMRPELFRVALAEVPFRDRAVTEDRGDLRVTVAVPSAGEARALFDAKLYKKKIQPVWIEVENNTDSTYWLMSVGLDPHFFTPTEAADAFSRRLDGMPDRLNQSCKAFSELGVIVYNKYDGG